MKKAFTAQKYETKDKLFNSLNCFAHNNRELVIQRTKPEEFHDKRLVIQRTKSEESQNQEILRCAQDDERFSLAPMREREELLCERSELSNSGEGYISCAEHTVTVFSPFTSHFSQLCLPSPDATRHPLPREGKNVSCAKHTEKNLFTYLPIHLFTFKKCAFTLAEVLITLGIIGIVAAMTLPTVVKNYQKHVYYNQFRKAVSKLENALQMYEYDHNCIGDLSLCGSVSQEDWSPHSYGYIDNFVEDISKYFNIAETINDNNYKDICSGYDKQNVKKGYQTSNNDYNADSYICANDYGEWFSSNMTAFITTDSVLYTFAQDGGDYGGGSFVDVNGPNKGPNQIGRDIFLFYIVKKIHWGGDETYNDEPCKPEKGYGCAAKLLREGKMNY